MGPRRTYNYGTFIAPPGCSAEEARREVCNTAFQGSPSYGVGSAPAFSAASIRGLEYHISPTGLRLEKQGECIVISKMGDDAARARGLCEGDVVTHIEGEPLLGSLKAGYSLIEQAGETLTLRIQPDDGKSNAASGLPRKTKFRAVQHIVRQGDSVETLAEMYRVTADEVRLWNRKYFPVGEPGFLCPGQVLTLRDTTADHTRDGQKTASCHSPSARRRKSGRRGGRKRMLYEVRVGDSMKAICERFNLKEGDVRGLNRHVFPIGETGTVLPGQMLTVFAEECDSLVSEEEGCSGKSAEDENEREFMQSLTGRKTNAYHKCPSVALGMRGAGVMG